MAPRSPLGHEFLDRAVCADPKCATEHAALIVGGMCHPEAGVRVLYARRSRVLDLWCAACGRFIASIAVASGRPSSLPAEVAHA